MKKKYGYGDDGYTSIYGGKKVGKDSIVIEVIGTVDELNSAIGVCRTLIKDPEVENILVNIQKALFKVGNEVQSIEIDREVKSGIVEEDMSRLDGWLKKYSEISGRLEGFIVPGGSLGSSYLHMTRAICRRAERVLTRYLRSKSIDRHICLSYLNRLSDLLFVLARYVSKIEGVEEEYL